MQTLLFILLFASSTTTHSAKVSKIYYINTDAATDRDAFMRTQLDLTGIPYERFPAVVLEEGQAGLERMLDEWQSDRIGPLVTVSRKASHPN